MSSVESVTPTAVVRRIFERLNDRDADAMSLFWSDDVAEVWPVVGRLDGKEAVRDYFVAIFAAMPDFHIDVERMAAADETVFVHWHMTGTFTRRAAPRHRCDRPFDRSPRDRLLHHPGREDRGGLHRLRRDGLPNPGRPPPAARQPDGPCHDGRRQLDDAREEAARARPVFQSASVLIADSARLRHVVSTSVVWGRSPSSVRS